MDERVSVQIRAELHKVLDRKYVGLLLCNSAFEYISRRKKHMHLHMQSKRRGRRVLERPKTDTALLSLTQSLEADFTFFTTL